MLLIPIPIIIAGGIIIGGTIAFFFLRKKANEKLKNKSVIMLGPSQSGKTTIINWLCNDKPTTEYFATGSENEVGTKYTNGYTISYWDMGGDSGLLTDGKFEIEFTKHDVVLFVFDINKYSLDSKYKSDVNARLEALKIISERHPMMKKVIMLIGSHADCYKKSKGITDDNELAHVFQDELTNLLKQKNYYQFVQSHYLILADLTKQKEIAGILKRLNEELKKLER